jgi:putative ABC transport system substrate-binding protein
MKRVTQSWRVFAAEARVSMTLAPCVDLADVERAFESLGDPPSAAAFLMLGGMSTIALPEAIAKDVYALAIRRRIATVGEPSEGALISHSASYTDAMGRMAAIVDKILRGRKAAEIPIELPDRTEFVLNRATAKAIGAVVTPELLLRATEVIG